ncbi:MAG TPA: YfcE family phosphodiesterase [Acidimicrobiales bacterium]|jgi:hypothetical protein
MGRTRIGVLSDTHMPSDLRELWDEVGVAFAGVDLIVHCGDISHPLVLDQCERWAPVVAALGNNDFDSGDPRIAPVQWLDVEGFRVAAVHDMEPEDEPIEVLCRRYLRDERPDVMLTGHTHFERMDYRDGVLQVNSGSAVHPHLWSTRMGTVAIVDFEPGRLRASIVRVGETEGLRNPGIEYAFDGTLVHRLG